ncbi:hypothetical protein ACP70R_031853 [Stipagrostis hirtigluma subsp. patula]
MAAHQNGLQESARVLEDGTSRVADHENSEQDGTSSRSMFSIQFVQKILAEFLGTYFLIFAGCAVVVVNQRTGGAATLLGIAITWGFTVMVMIYSIGHVSGAHFNPAVTIAFATCGRFPWKQVPAYVAGQVTASIAASLTLVLLFGSAKEHFFGTVPKGSDTQSLVLEFITSFYLMFVISGVATDNRAIGEVSGLAIGGTVLLNILFAGNNIQQQHFQINGPSAQAYIRSIHEPGKDHRPSDHFQLLCKHLVIVGPVCGTVAGAWAYNLLRFTDKPLGALSRRHPS